MHTPTESDVRAAADAIVRAFAATDADAYFRAFAADATFIFHPEASRLNARSEYESRWNEWLTGGWRVTSCSSTDPLIQSFPGGAVFSHTVHTSITSDEGPDSYTERETIVFQATANGNLIAIHEHLSTVPTEHTAETKEPLS